MPIARDAPSLKFTIQAACPLSPEEDDDQYPSPRVSENASTLIVGEVCDGSTSENSSAIFGKRQPRPSRDRLAQYSMASLQEYLPGAVASCHSNPQHDAVTAPLPTYL